MQAEKRTLGTIFEPTIRLLAPLEQRPYVWQRDENWQPLWEAVREAAEQRITTAPQGRPYFLGAIVLSQVLSEGVGMETWEIIDGQQRLTTLQVLFAVIRDLYTSAGAGEHASEIARWIANPSIAAPHADDRFKVWPTNVDRDDFRKVMTAGNPFAVYHRYTAPAFTNGQTMPAGFGANDDPAVRQHLLQWATLSREEYAAAQRLLSPTQKQEAATYINQWAQTAQEQSNKTPADLLKHFQRYANVYQQFEHYPLDSREGLFFHRLTQLDNTTVLPLLLEVVLRYGQPHQASQLRQILVDIESYLVRRLVCGLSPKNYNRFFREIVRSLKAADDFSPEAIRAALLRSFVTNPHWPDDAADTARWPGDAEFKQAWIESGFYNMLRQQRTRMILEALDQHQQSSLAGARIIFKKLTIEHLLPQSWQAHWPLPDGADLAQTSKERKELLHTIGNLTLLSGPLNARVSNGSWDAKHAHIRKHSISNLNTQLPAVWDEAAIRHRTATLFKDAIVIWPYPAA